MLNKLRKFDMYRKVPEDHTQQTLVGGLFSILSLSIIFTLFCIETYSYFTAAYKTQLSVEGLQTSDRFRIDLNITFHHIPCEVISAHYSDQSETHYTATTFRRVRISNTGTYLWDRESQRLSMSPSVIQGKAKCGSCFGAELSEDQCCNTCEEVIEAYQNRKWALPDKNAIEQCRRKLRSSSNTEGCLLFGYLFLKKAPAMFHFSLTPIGQMMLATNTLAIDGSHTIHYVKISDPEYGFEYGRSAIENYSSSSGDITQYYLRISPATLPSGIYFYESSVHSTSIDMNYPPEIVFQYDMEPIITNYLNRQSFFEYLVHLCGIIGGWYAVTLFVSRLFLSK